jgi:hypothetical protein
MTRRDMHGLHREEGDPLKYPCPICGAPEDWACEPIRASKYPIILRPHRGRGLAPYYLAERGWVQRPDGLWRKPRRKPRPTFGATDG